MVGIGPTMGQITDPETGLETALTTGFEIIPTIGPENGPTTDKKANRIIYPITSPITRIRMKLRCEFAGTNSGNRVYSCGIYRLRR